MTRLPKKLERDPIIEALFELRFKPAQAALADLLPGLLYPLLKDILPRSEAVPLGSSIPRELTQQLTQSNPELKYQPRARLAGNKFSLLIGDYSVLLSCPRPYVGWDKFRPTIAKIVNSLIKTKVIQSAERFSLKYVNVLPAESLTKQYQMIKLAANIGKHDLTQTIAHFRAQFVEDGFTNIVELSANAKLKMISGEIFSGIHLAIDTISSGATDILTNIESNIEKAHAVEKAIFFDVLSDKAIKDFKPVWE